METPQLLGDPYRSLLGGSQLTFGTRDLGSPNFCWTCVWYLFATALSRTALMLSCLTCSLGRADM